MILTYKNGNDIKIFNAVNLKLNLSLIDLKLSIEGLNAIHTFEGQSLVDFFQRASDT